ncbi:hypothetical protein B0H15DRAFT_564959 [Mycena belliarum]|uniref:Uncharacterized protein n=1 Tax=Mycena belliarum TaxID=1033014 RepID=A0AAD6TWU7_9AGAR|nr:hypothetical protein B0H15DRAFT_564959 [Mycena belliae]
MLGFYTVARRRFGRNQHPEFGRHQSDAPYLWFAPRSYGSPLQGRFFRAGVLSGTRTRRRRHRILFFGQVEAAHAHTLVTASSPPASVTGTTCNSTCIPAAASFLYHFWLSGDRAGLHVIHKLLSPRGARFRSRRSRSGSGAMRREDLRRAHHLRQCPLLRSHRCRRAIPIENEAIPPPSATHRRLVHMSPGVSVPHRPPTWFFVIPPPRRCARC